MEEEKYQSQQQKDQKWAGLCQLLFLQEKDINKLWNISFPEGNELYNAGSKFTDIYSRIDLRTNLGGRVHYFRNLQKGLSVIAFCPIENFANWGKSAVDWKLVDLTLTKPEKPERVIEGPQKVMQEYPSVSINMGKPEKSNLRLCDYLIKLTKEDKNRKIYTGMSFGGAMASLFARIVPCSELVLIGALNIGNTHLVNSIMVKNPNIRNYANPGDPVPRLPPFCARILPQIDPEDCSIQGHATGHINLLCHGHYLGVNFATVDVYVHAAHYIDDTDNSIMTEFKKLAIGADRSVIDQTLVVVDQ